MCFAKFIKLFSYCNNYEIEFKKWFNFTGAIHISIPDPTLSKKKKDLGVILII